MLFFSVNGYDTGFTIHRLVHRFTRIPSFDSLKTKVQEALLHFKELKNEVLSLFTFYRDLAEAL